MASGVLPQIKGAAKTKIQASGLLNSSEAGALRWISWSWGSNVGTGSISKLLAQAKLDQPNLTRMSSHITLPKLSTQLGFVNAKEGQEKYGGAGVEDRGTQTVGLPRVR